jgi:restriction system protein
MHLPKYHETFIPTLKVLSENGNTSRQELRTKVVANFYSHLPPEIRSLKTRSGANVLIDRIGWGKSYLRMGKFVDYPERGMVKITEKGIKILDKGKFSISDLRNDPDFIKHKGLTENKKAAKLEEETFENNSPQDLIDQGINTIETEVKSELLSKLKNIDPYYFERVILILLNKMGYGDFIETSKSRDGGIDGIINEDKLGLEKIYTQAKRYSDKTIREKDIRNFIGAMSGDTSKGVFITTSSFDKTAIEKAKSAHHKIILIDGDKLVDLMFNYNVGVQTSTTYEVKELDNDFFDAN